MNLAAQDHSLPDQPCSMITLLDCMGAQILYLNLWCYVGHPWLPFHKPNEPCSEAVLLLDHNKAFVCIWHVNNMSSQSLLLTEHKFDVLERRCNVQVFWQECHTFSCERVRLWRWWSVWLLCLLLFRNVIQLVDELDPILDAPSKRTLWNFILPRMSADHRLHVTQHVHIPAEHITGTSSFYHLYKNTVTNQC